MGETGVSWREAGRATGQSCSWAKPPSSTALTKTLVDDGDDDDDDDDDRSGVS